ncbi:hypothetical protein CCM_09327 [Cordyceps militaris CM01]|uniref:Uncharacterized protein n=1 Tax=Cordyceps militaris (strain CM01) TaxID=983644 RepID=G3JU37_CORMM|nr:uncharacterized protein CCM_09327 [Cordyceps militaris CM01]EGX88191.1 hypothetical protein CCM_09327 [Cordyceps militaris CM01]
MANKPWRDWIYLAVIGLQFTGMIGIPIPASPPMVLPSSRPRRLLPAGAVAAGRVASAFPRGSAAALPGAVRGPVLLGGAHAAVVRRVPVHRGARAVPARGVPGVGAGGPEADGGPGGARRPGVWLPDADGLGGLLLRAAAHGAGAGGGGQEDAATVRDILAVCRDSGGFGGGHVLATAAAGAGTKCQSKGRMSAGRPMP